MPRSRRLRFSIWMFFAAAALVAFTFVIATRPPRWYQPPDRADPAVAARASDVEYDVVVQMQQVREAQHPWQLEVGEADINAWLAARLPDWWVQQGLGDWPRDIGAPQVRVREGGRFAIVLPVALGAASALVQATGSIELNDDALLLRIDGTSLGYAPLPRAFVSRVSGFDADDAVSAFLSDLFRDGIELEPVVTLADRRRVRASALRTESGRVIWTLRTEPRVVESSEDAAVGVTSDD